MGCILQLTGRRTPLYVTFLSVPLGGSEAAIEGVELGALDGDAADGDVAGIGVATGGGCADPCC